MLLRLASELTVDSIYKVVLGRNDRGRFITSIYRPPDDPTIIVLNFTGAGVVLRVTDYVEIDVGE